MGTPRLHCAGCGSAYALETVGALGTFRCSVCGEIVVVPTVLADHSPAPPAPAPAPVSRPPAARTPPAARSAPAARSGPPAHSAPAARTKAAAASRPTGRAARPQRKGGTRSPASPAVVAAVVGIVAVAVVGLVVARSRGGGGDAPADVGAGGAGGKAPTASQEDPRVDATVWKSLPASERTRLVDETFRNLSRTDLNQLRFAAGFFGERNEKAARDRVAAMAVEADPTATWAHDILGDVELGKLVDDALAESPRAEEIRTDAVSALERIAHERRPASGPWFADAADATEIKTLVRQIRDDENGLQDDYRYGVARWVTYQRTLEVMKDYPALHEAIGPYVVFVQVGGAKRTDLSDADELELRRANRIMNEMRTLLPAFYDGWHRDLGPTFGLTKYGPDNASFDTLLKVNVFARSEDFEIYSRRRHLISPYWAGVRAFYCCEEPRFIVTHDGDDESAAETYQVQCHEAVHQLVHFYSRELTQAARGKAPSWTDCAPRPLWSSEGFAEFFSSFEKTGASFEWMQPNAPSMELIWIVNQAFPKLKWRDWSLVDLLAVDEGTALTEACDERTPRPAQGRPMTAEWAAWRDAVSGVYGSLYYARAWSLVYFLWYADEGGRPKYRNRLVNYLKREWVVPKADDPMAEDGCWTEALFFDALGLHGPDDLRKLDDEWRTWVARFVDEHQSADWLPTRHRLFKLFGVR